MCLEARLMRDSPAATLVARIPAGGRVKQAASGTRQHRLLPMRTARIQTHAARACNWRDSCIGLYSYASALRGKTGGEPYPEA